MTVSLLGDYLNTHCLFSKMCHSDEETLLAINLSDKKYYRSLSCYIIALINISVSVYRLFLE